MLTSFWTCSMHQKGETKGKDYFLVLLFLDASYTILKDGPILYHNVEVPNF